ncbi:MAG: nucleotidyltransferase domain-containing protein [Candidatus Scalindua rubra]|uniref:Nucleotidyltransferase domain protein n=1 Tax=Candidatus Scalindua brodae TaxID=237368 RepID=A0A0B0ETL0_9BACT|nr:MAG: Nucleotidyltransferase domain protein [Candidatus Scalindua brodae]MBZ0108986.1 nucleotidyltransferase domain-containing protein [Candidatus Scalindua rubra]
MINKIRYNKLNKRWLLEREERKKLSRKMLDVVSIKGKTVFRKFDIKKVLLFGSVVEERSFNDSDVDILVLPLKKDQYWECLRELENAIAFPVDLYTQDDDVKLVDKILSRGKVVYEI